MDLCTKIQLLWNWNQSNPISQKHPQWALFSVTQVAYSKAPDSRNTYAGTHLSQPGTATFQTGTPGLPPRYPLYTQNTFLSSATKNLQRLLTDKIKLLSFSYLTLILPYFLLCPSWSTALFQHSSLKHKYTPHPTPLFSPSPTLFIPQGPGQVTLPPHSFLWLQLLPISSLPNSSGSCRV